MHKHSNMQKIKLSIYLNIPIDTIIILRIIFISKYCIPYINVSRLPRLKSAPSHSCGIIHDKLFFYKKKNINRTEINFP